MISNIIYKTDHTRFAGVINASEFDTEFTDNLKSKSSYYAEKVCRCWRFDDMCRRNIIGRDRFDD